MGEGVEHDEHGELSLKHSNFIYQKQHVFSFTIVLLIGKIEKEVRSKRCLR